MLDITLLIIFSVMAYRIATTIRRESNIFREFNQPKTLALVVMLFPLGPIMLIAGSAHLPFPLAFVGAAACYLPAFISARRLTRVFETAGTDRVKSAQEASTQATGMALVGFIYVTVGLIYSLFVSVVNHA